MKTQTINREWLETTISKMESARDEMPFGLDEDGGNTLAALKLALAGLEIGLMAYPETLPCPVLFEPGMRFGKGVKTKVMLNFLQRRAERYTELEAMTPEQRTEHDAGMNEMREMLGVPPLPVPGSTGATDFLPPPPMPTAIPVQATVNDVTYGKPLTITLPDTSSKAFWSGSGKSEVFHPEIYKRWVKEAIERNCCIARIEVKVK